MDGLNSLAKQINETAKSKGWWDGTEVSGRDPYVGDFKTTVPRPVGEVLALVHSEVSEALEEYRDGHDLRRMRYVHPDGTACDPDVICRARAGVNSDAKPEGFPIELADVLIRVLDACAEWDIDIEEAMRVKIQYNSTRKHRHGGKLA